MKRGGPLKRDGEGARRFADQRSELKRTEMKRSTPAPTARSTLKSTTRIKPRSAARQKTMTEDRIPMIEAFAAVGVGCEIGMVFEEYGIDSGCTGRLEGLHERRKRSAGGSLVNRLNLVPACNRCNGYIEDEPEEVRRLTGDLLVLREGDRDWPLASKRNDRVESDHAPQDPSAP